MVPGLLAWDSIWMLQIAQCGYDTEQSHAFLPLLPGMCKASCSHMRGRSRVPDTTSQCACRAVEILPLQGHVLSLNEGSKFLLSWEAHMRWVQACMRWQSMA